MKDEALELALYALDIVKIHFTQNRHVNEAITAINQALSASVQSAERGEPVAWEDGLKNLVVRSDMRDRLNYKGPWIGMGRSIPDSWVPILYTTPPAAPKEKP